MSVRNSSATANAGTSRTRSSYDDVTCPRHYEGDGKIQAKRALNSMLVGYDKADSCSRSTAHWCACAFKYLWRWPLKNGKQDLLKAQECIRLAVESLD